jgi:short-subunit dehydrogenase
MGLALVTGASAGIGRELAIECARDKQDVVLVARRQADLDRLAGELQSNHGIWAEGRAFDLAAPGAAERLVERLDAEGLQVDVLINNAGFGLFGPFLEGELRGHLETIQVNIAALTDLTYRLTPGMIQRGTGRILNVASTAAFQPGPLMAVYYASKAYVLHFSEALANELSGTGVSVTALCPGPTRTGFQARAGMTGIKMLKGPVMDSSRVARAGYRGMQKGKRIVIPGLVNKIVAQSYRISPRRLTAAVVRWIQTP